MSLTLASVGETKTGSTPPASHSSEQVYSREALSPGVWINHEKLWQQADAVIPGAADWDYEPDLAFLAEDKPKRRWPFPEWHREAACVGHEEQTFFGARDTTERPAVSMSDIARAKAICNECPVFRTCLETALGLRGENREEYGIWAGTSGRTRKRIWELVDHGQITLEIVIEDICTGKGMRYERSAEVVLVRLKTDSEAVA